MDVNDQLWKNERRAGYLQYKSMAHNDLKFSFQSALPKLFSLLFSYIVICIFFNKYEI